MAARRLKEAYADMKGNRRSIRLPGYDYSSAGAYFVTVCTRNRSSLFGQIADGTMMLNDAGRMVQTVWDQLSQQCIGVQTDVFIVMPNHVHGIIVLGGVASNGLPEEPPSPSPTIGIQSPRESNGSTASLPEVVHRFKSITTKQYAEGTKKFGWPQFAGRLWQRNYYEHIIRDEDEWNRAREYIMNNPIRWETDRENPAVDRTSCKAEEFEHDGGS